MKNIQLWQALSLVLISISLPAFSASEAEMNKPAAPTLASSDKCPDYLNVEFRKLHSKETVNLCQLYQGKPMLFVNTASHCGYTPQFKELEALYQRYKEKGFQVVGFSSNDFNQTAKSEKKAAGICYKNYGVSFTMLAPTNVKGENANATFKYLSSQTKEPQWNFNKYLVEGKSNKVFYYESNTKPLESELENNLKKLVF